jgi:hypothetical protein
MSRWLGVIVIFVGVFAAVSQTSSKFQPGTITAVTAHQNAPGEAASNAARYDVSVKVGNTVYVVLYTPPNGAKSVEYSGGMSLLVLVGRNTLTFNSTLSGRTEVPILRRETLPAQSGLDWSKAPSQYFSMKQQHLSETLDLNEDQQAKIRPILEQESAEAGQVLGNPVISRKDQLNRWEKIVQSSDAKIKPLLSKPQLEKLESMRKEQKQDLKKLVAEKKAEK